MADGEALMTPCGHASDFCHECLTQHARTALEDGAVVKSGIRCIAAGCNDEVPDSCVLSTLNSTMSNQFRRWKRLAQIEKDPNLRWCPQAGCEQIIDTAQTRRCVCSAEVCLDCGAHAHEGKPCLEAADEGLRVLAKAMGWVRCPHCGKHVERTEGCDSMRCVYLGCARLFCYSCGKPRDIGGTDPKRCKC